jgi:hypothetical protein
MALKRSHGSSRATTREINREEEWTRSISSEAALNVLVVHGVLPDRATAGWRSANGEEFPTPRTDELVVFEDYFYLGFVVPIHPFLCRLIDYYKISPIISAQILSFMLPSSSIFARRIWESFPTSTSFVISSASKSRGIRI